MHFDARAAKLLKPGEHIIVAESPGLRLVATASRRTWTYRYKSPVDERMRQVALGHWPAMSLAAATVAWESFRAKRDAGEDPAQVRRKARATVAKPQPQPQAYTVRVLCQDYLAGHVRQHRKPKGYAEVKRMFERDLGELADMLPTEVTRAVAFNHLEAMADRPVAAGNLRAELGAAWDYALDAGRLPAETPNWWRQVMRRRLRSKGKKREGKHVGTAKRVLSDAELSVLLPWLGHFSLLVRDVLTLYLWTCARGAEIVAIQKNEISQEADGLWWTCPKHKTKNARHELATDLRVPLVGWAEAVVRRRMKAVAKADGYLFAAASASGHAQQNGVQSAVHYRQPYSKTNPHHERARLPVTHWSPHDLRRTSRTMLAAMGCPEDVGEAIIGHMLPGVRGVYNRHTYDAERRVWLTRLSMRLEALARGQLPALGGDGQHSAVVEDPTPGAARTIPPAP